MKQFRNFYVVMAIMAVLFTASCGGSSGDDTPAPLTNNEKLEGTWKISEAYVNGSRFAASEGGSFRMTFAITADGAPAGYSVVDQSGVARPDFNHEGTTSGSWSFESGFSILQFIHGSGLTSSVTITGAVIEEGKVTIEWTLPDPDAANPGGDKTNPSYKYVLIPQ